MGNCCEKGAGTLDRPGQNRPKNRAEASDRGSSRLSHHENIEKIR